LCLYALAGKKSNPIFKTLWPLNKQVCGVLSFEQKKSWRISNKIKLEKNELEVFILLSTYPQNSESNIRYRFLWEMHT
jgi:hypothetical protein